MKTLPLVACLLAASPAFSQPRVYTNADLGQPLSPTRVTVTPQQLASLAAQQFVSLSFERPWGSVVSAGSSPTAGPFGDYRQTILRKRGRLALDGSAVGVDFVPPPLLRPFRVRPVPRVHVGHPVRVKAIPPVHVRATQPPRPPRAPADPRTRRVQTPVVRALKVRTVLGAEIHQAACGEGEGLLRGFARAGTQSHCSGRTDRVCCAA